MILMILLLLKMVKSNLKITVVSRDMILTILDQNVIDQIPLSPTLFPENLEEWVLNAFKKKDIITSDNFYKALDIGFTFQRVYKPKGQSTVVLSPTTINGKDHQLRCSTCSTDANPVYHHISRFQAYTIDLKKKNIKPYSSCASKVGEDDYRSLDADLKLICLWCHKSLSLGLASDLAIDEEDRFCDRDCVEAYGGNSEVQAQKVSPLSHHLQYCLTLLLKWKGRFSLLPLGNTLNYFLHYLFVELLTYLEIKERSRWHCMCLWLCSSVCSLNQFH